MENKLDRIVFEKGNFRFPFPNESKIIKKLKPIGNPFLINFRGYSGERMSRRELIKEFIYKIDVDGKSEINAYCIGNRKIIQDHENGFTEFEPIQFYKV